MRKYKTKSYLAKLFNLLCDPLMKVFLNIFKLAIFLFDTYYWFKDIKQRK